MLSLRPLCCAGEVLWRGGAQPGPAPRRLPAAGRLCRQAAPHDGAVGWVGRPGSQRRPRMAARLPARPRPACLTCRVPLASLPRAPRVPPHTADDLQVVAELPIKAARELCFSNGGALFAAANGNTAHIYCAHTCASLAVLRGHNGKVRRRCGAGVQEPPPRHSCARSQTCCTRPLPSPSAQVRGLWWAADDATLVTAGADGAVYEWRVHEGRRSRDFVQNGWSYSAVVGGAGGWRRLGRTAAWHAFALPPALDSPPLACACRAERHAARRRSPLVCPHHLCLCD